MKPASFRLTTIFSFLLVIASPSVFASDAPYSLSKYHSILDASKLQAPDSSTAIRQGHFPGISEWYFHLDASGKYMTFEMDGSKNRSELRQMDEWYTSASTWQKIIGEVKVFYPETPSLNQFTFMQIHDSGTEDDHVTEIYNKPLIRLAWIRDRGGADDHLWAIIRLSSSIDSFEYINLGSRPDSFFKCEIKVKNNKMRVRINNETKLELDVSYWEQLRSYFKSGVYLQSEGTAKVQFRKLKYYAY